MVTLLILILVGSLAWGAYHSSAIAQARAAELAKLLEDMKKLQALNAEITQAYRDALESLRECQQEDPCNPDHEYC